MTSFAFLKAEWPDIYEAAAKAESAVFPDPRTSCFYARRALELLVGWAFKSDATLKLPYQENISALVHEPTFKQAAGEAVFTKARLIIKLGNQAVHSQRSIPDADSVVAVRELFHVGYWFARSYARKQRPSPGLLFDAAQLPRTAIPKQTIDQLVKLEEALKQRDEQLSALSRDKDSLNDELQRLRAEVAAAKAAAAHEPDTHDYSESETRDLFIDVLLKEAGWALDQPRDREYQVTGMPNDRGVGFVDYVLWGDDGRPLGLVEAKRTRVSPKKGQEQAKRYADCLEREFGQRPVIFYSNGYEHWIWDDCSYPPRSVEGFYKRDELELLIQRRSTKKRLDAEAINQEIAGRYYQTRAIRRIGEAFERDCERKSLLVMATGSGKTRTTIALVDLLMRCNWVKRVLFLADRRALVKQAKDAFNKHLPDATVVNLISDRGNDGARVYVSTYPTMMGLIDEATDGLRRFGSGYFDLIIIDEAHRSVYVKYKAIFKYFDALLVGLTATPKDEVDVNTYSLFDLERGVPTDNYGLDDAVKDGFLVPAKAVSVPLKFQREGITYDDLSDAEKEQWDELEWDEDNGTPSHVDPAALNKWLFNQGTVDKVLKHLMTRGQTVMGGDRLGKTIIFAKNQSHAEFIEQRFNVNYPHYKGAFARVVHCDMSYAQSLIDDFSVAAKPPHIAISVDMLDTGIDVPEVVNLVFFKMVRSRTKFWQMVGRGTRLCEDLFAPGQHKEFFYIFDFCENLEFFKDNPPVVEGSIKESLGTKLFKTRLELIAVLDHPPAPAQSATDLRTADKDATSYSGTSVTRTSVDLRREVAALLQGEVTAMNVQNFVVRPKRRLIEKYTKPEAWTTLPSEAISELARDVAGLPTELDAEDEESKRFDLLVLRLQLAVLRSEPGFKRMSEQIRAIAGLLEEKASIPMVRAQLSLIHEIQDDEWWQDVTVVMLENARKRLRALVKLIDKRQRKPIYTDFEDQMGDEVAVELSQFASPVGFERFRAKVRAFLREHEDHIAIHKLRMNKALTQSDLDELERILASSAVGQPEDLEQAKMECNGLGLFVRSLVGLDRNAAKEAFAEFLSGTSFRANQIEFINLIINHLTEHGTMAPELLYASPFTDITPTGPESLFTSAQVDQLIVILESVTAAAMAAG
jgi:type I restriction enzyme R subunit